MAIYRRSILFRLAAEPIAYVWSGHGPIEIIDDIDPDGAIYVGAGGLISVPALRQLVNGTADRLDFVLSGITSDTLRLAREDAESVNGALALIGEVIFDEAWQIVSTGWLWRGYADVLTVDSQATGSGRERTIQLSVRSNDTFRSNPQPAYFTDQDQRRRSPTDAIFSHVNRISQGARRRFGPGA